MKLPAIFHHKKFQAALSGIWMLLAADDVPGIAMSQITAMGIIAIVVGYMYSQGQADKGKEAAKINAEAAEKLVKAAEPAAAG